MVNLTKGQLFCNLLDRKYIRKFRNEVRGIGIGHGGKSGVISFLADKGDSLLWEGNNGISAIHNGVMSCEVRHSWEDVILVQ